MCTCQGHPVPSSESLSLPPQSGTPGRGLFRVQHSRRRHPGLGGVLSTMRALTAEGSSDPRIRATALHITRDLAPDASGNPNRRNRRAIAEAVYAWVVKHVHFANDPHGVEMLQKPHVTLGFAAGDCDDHSILVASLLEALGVPTRFRLWGLGDQPSHVLPEFQDDAGTWHTVDTSRPNGIGYVPGIPLGYDQTVPSTSLSDWLERLRNLFDVHGAGDFSPQPAVNLMPLFMLAGAGAAVYLASR